LKNVCVPIDYNESSFCDMTVYLNSSSVDHQQHNHCYEVISCNETGTFVQKRSNATEWEKHSNACSEYKCVNESGPIHNDFCSVNDTMCHHYECQEDGTCKEQGTVNDNSTKLVNDCYKLFCDDENGRTLEYNCSEDEICVDDKCTDRAAMNEKVKVEIEVNGVPANENSSMEIKTVISEQTAVDVEKLKITLVIDKQGLINEMILYADDEHSAEVISNVVNECASRRSFSEKHIHKNATIIM